MAAPRYKVYDEKSRLVAAVTREDMGMQLIATFGCFDWTLRDGHSVKKTLWEEGKDGLADEHEVVVALRPAP